MKVPTSRAELPSKERQELTKTCLKTLESLMASLMLQEDYKAVAEGHRKAILQEQNEKRVRIVPAGYKEEKEGERLIKLLLRCRKMSDAK